MDASSHGPLLKPTASTPLPTATRDGTGISQPSTSSVHLHDLVWQSSASMTGSAQQRPQTNATLSSAADVATSTLRQSGLPSIHERMQNWLQHDDLARTVRKQSQGSTLGSADEGMAGRNAALPPGPGNSLKSAGSSTMQSPQSPSCWPFPFTDVFKHLGRRLKRAGSRRQPARSCSCSALQDQAAALRQHATPDTSEPRRSAMLASGEHPAHDSHNLYSRRSSRPSARLSRLGSEAHAVAGPSHGADPSPAQPHRGQQGSSSQPGKPQGDTTACAAVPGGSRRSSKAGSRETRIIPSSWTPAWLASETRGSSASPSSLGSPLSCSELIRAAVQAQAHERQRTVSVQGTGAASAGMAMPLIGFSPAGSGGGGSGMGAGMSNLGILQMPCSQGGVSSSGFSAARRSIDCAMLRSMDASPAMRQAYVRSRTGSLGFAGSSSGGMTADGSFQALPMPMFMPMYAQRGQDDPAQRRTRLPQSIANNGSSEPAPLAPPGPAAGTGDAHAARLEPAFTQASETQSRYCTSGMQRYSHSAVQPAPGPMTGQYRHLVSLDAAQAGGVPVSVANLSSPTPTRSQNGQRDGSDSGLYLAYSGKQAQEVRSACLSAAASLASRASQYAQAAMAEEQGLAQQQEVAVQQALRQACHAIELKYIADALEVKLQQAGTPLGRPARSRQQSCAGTMRSRQVSCTGALGMRPRLSSCTGAMPLEMSWSANAVTSAAAGGYVPAGRDLVWKSQPSALQVLPTPFAQMSAPGPYLAASWQAGRS